MLVQLHRNDMVFKKSSMSEQQIMTLTNLITNDRSYGRPVFARFTDSEIVVKASRSVMYLYLHKLSQHFDIELM